MKTCPVIQWILGFALAGTPWFVSLAQDNSSPADATAPVTTTPASSAMETAAVPSLPAGVYASPTFAALVKLARGGLADEGALAFVRNAAGTFNLGSDQIIYLNDLGVSSEVITAMIQHDQALTSGLLPSTTSPLPAPRPVLPGALPANSPGLSSVADPGPTTAEVNRDGFFNALSPYGNWVNLDAYGWCWQPTVAFLHRGWRPYRDAGQWQWTDHGWYWTSDYSWGGIVFHYGRWLLDPQQGWCWWPDAAWGPSWVTWRYTGDFCGWAPLPPNTAVAPGGVGLACYGAAVAWNFGFDLGEKSYSFVAWTRFHGRPPGKHCLRGLAAAETFADSAVVNDVFLGNDSAVVNRGLPLYRVAQAAGGEIPIVPIRNVPAPTAESVQPDRIAVEDGNLVILHPTTQAAATGESVVATTAPANLPPWPVLPPIPLRSVVRWSDGAMNRTDSAAAISTADNPTEPAPPAAGTPRKPTSIYPVRSSQPEPLTDPIIWPRPLAPGAPNLMRLDWFPRS